MKSRNNSTQLFSLSAMLSGATLKEAHRHLDRAGRVCPKPTGNNCSPPGLLPVTAVQYGYMRQKELMKLLPISPATLWRKVKAGTFVKPIKLSACITAWNRAEVIAWLDELEGGL